MRRFQVVVAATLTHGIGKDNSQPWRLPGDLAHFKAITTGSTQPGKRNAVVRAPPHITQHVIRTRPSASRVSLCPRVSERPLPKCARSGGSPGGVVCACGAK
jgi:hypothetical protein